MFKTLHHLFSSAIAGTITVNLLGSILIGLFIGLELKSLLNKPMLLLLVTGFCGGFTTFSTFALEYHNLFKTGEYVQAFLYISASVVFGLLAIVAGFFLARQIHI
jgi:CrcB protein